jgi:ATP-binding cassette subfamily F protein uup
MGETAINLVDLHHSFGERVLFDGVSLGIHAGEKVGLIGDNGTGKSTLIRMIAALAEPEAGSIEVRRDLSVAHLAQSPELRVGATIRELLQEPFAELLAAIGRYEEAAAAEDPEAVDLLGEIDRLGGWNWEHRLTRAAVEAGFAADGLDVVVDNFSGGERKRVALARMRLSDADILLLDEPTNHLDSETVEGLEAWLAGTEATTIIVTHDRYFLEAVVDRIVELRGGKCSTYRGGYMDYLVARAAEEEHSDRVRHRRLQALRTEIEWARRSPKARTTKAKARLGRIDAAEAEQEALKPSARTAEFRFGEGPRLGKTILELEDLRKSYDDGPPVVDGLTLKMVPGDRLGIVGPNGCGKTTLLRLALGELEPDQGRVVVGHNTKIAYFDQHRVHLDLAVSLRETLAPDGGDHVFPAGRKVHVTGWLKRFAFPPNVHGMAVGQLSGGERNRLAIARFLLSDANLLLLDEPTNDLDLLTLNLFEDALLEFPGCVLVVSHDRYFLDKVVTGVLGFSEGGEVTAHAGGYSAHRAHQLALAAEEAAAARTVGKAAVPPATAAERARKKGLGFMEKRELEDMEDRIAAADAEVARLEAAFAAPDLWAEGPAPGQAIQAELAAARAAAEALYERWAELTERE